MSGNTVPPRRNLEAFQGPRATAAAPGHLRSLQHISFVPFVRALRMRLPSCHRSAHRVTSPHPKLRRSGALTHQARLRWIKLPKTASVGVLSIGTWGKSGVAAARPTHPEHCSTLKRTLLSLAVVVIADCILKYLYKLLRGPVLSVAAPAAFLCDEFSRHDVGRRALEMASLREQPAYATLTSCLDPPKCARFWPDRSCHFRHRPRVIRREELELWSHYRHMVSEDNWCGKTSSQIPTIDCSCLLLTSRQGLHVTFPTELPSLPCATQCILRISSALYQYIS